MKVSSPGKECGEISFEVALLSLSTINGLGRKGLKALVREFQGDLGAVWKASPEQLRRVLAASNVHSAAAPDASIRDAVTAFNRASTASETVAPALEGP